MQPRKSRIAQSVLVDCRVSFQQKVLCGVRRINLTTEDVLTGVPQISVLSPPFIPVYISNLNNEPEGARLLLSNDVRLRRNSDILRVPENADFAPLWCVDWRMSLDTDRCRQQTDEYRRENSAVLYDFSKPVAMVSISIVTDLGVLKYTDVEQGMHCLETAKKYILVPFEPQKTVASRMRRVLLPIYRTYLKPCLEYDAKVCGHSPVRNNAVLVKRLFTRISFELSPGSI